MRELSLKFELIRCEKKPPRLIVSVSSSDGSFDESVECNEVVKAILKCVQEEEVEKRN